VTPLLPSLSAREESVLLLLGDGAGLREIAAILGATERATRRIRDRARVRLGAITTTHAVAIVVRARSDAR
jgi:DNA-binding CsgD family transcriptional regulator